MSAELIIDAAAGIDIEIETALKSLRSGRVRRIQSADFEIPRLYADIKRIEGLIERHRKDREWCFESLKTLDQRLAEMGG